MESPKVLKKDFATFMRKLEEQSRENIQKILNEDVAKCFVNFSLVKSRSGRAKRSQFDQVIKKVANTEAYICEKCGEKPVVKPEMP